MVVERQYINADRFVELVQQPQYDDCIVELVEGVIVEMPRPSAEHGEILMLLSRRLANYVYENKLGRVLVGDTGFILEQKLDGKDTVRGLDLAFISIDRAPKPLPRGLSTVVPDLVAEIISPSNSAQDIHQKIRQLSEAGTALIWIIYPESRTVAIHTPSGATTLEESDTLTGGEVLAGFEVQVADIFPS